MERARMDIRHNIDQLRALKHDAEERGSSAFAQEIGLAIDHAQVLLDEMTPSPKQS